MSCHNSPAHPLLSPRKFRFLLDSGGLTFVEVLVCLIIVGLLSLIAIPSYSNFRDKAHNSRCVAEIRDLETTIAATVADTSTYPTVAQLGLDTRRDPWGHFYVYGAPDRKDFDFINTDYDLYSKGRDGLSGQRITLDESHDDIIRANDGAFLGLVGIYLGD